MRVKFDRRRGSQNLHSVIVRALLHGHAPPQRYVAYRGWTCWANAADQPLQPPQQVDGSCETWSASSAHPLSLITSIRMSFPHAMFGWRDAAWMIYTIRHDFLNCLRTLQAGRAQRNEVIWSANAEIEEGNLRRAPSSQRRPREDEKISPSPLNA